MERPPGDRPNRQGKCEEQPHLVWEIRYEHREDDRRNEPGDGDDEKKAPRRDIALALRSIFIERRGCSIAGALDRSDQCRYRNVRFMLDGRAFGGEIDVRRRNAGDARERSRDMRDAGRTRHAADREFGTTHNKS